jgi:hypothetical protein
MLSRNIWAFEFWSILLIIMTPLKSFSTRRLHGIYFETRYIGCTAMQVAICLPYIFTNVYPGGTIESLIVSDGCRYQISMTNCGPHLKRFHGSGSPLCTSHVQCSTNRFDILLALYFALVWPGRSQQHAHIIHIAFGVHHIHARIGAFVVYPSRRPPRYYNSASPANVPISLRGPFTPLRNCKDTPLLVS